MDQARSPRSEAINPDGTLAARHRVSAPIKCDGPVHPIITRGETTQSPWTVPSTRRAVRPEGMSDETRTASQMDASSVTDPETPGRLHRQVTAQR